MKEPKRQLWKIIGRGFNGWHAAAKNISSSGGDLNPYTYWTGEPCDGYAREAQDGCPVYDASGIELVEPADTAFCREVIRGPMVDTELPDQGPEAYLHVDGFSFVPVAEKIRRLRQIPGIQFGTVRNGSVVWE